MEKAKLYYEYLQVKNGTLDFQFNPGSITISKKNNWKGEAEPGRDHPVMIFAGGQPASYDIDLFFDAYANGYDKPTDIRLSVNTLFSLTLRGAGYSLVTAKDPFFMVPPDVFFIWGNTQLFRAVIESVSATYEAFDSNGTPTRAKCKVKFTERNHMVFDFLPPQNPTSRSDARATHKVMPGERLDLIAYQAYRDTGRWREIAEANGIDDPFTLASGRNLSLPEW